MLAFFTAMLGGVNQGLFWALMALGVFITFRILNFADLTTEGSFALGGSVAAMLISNNVEPILSTLIAIVAGALAGCCTGLLHTKLKIPPILAGILTMIALYSINIRIMGNRTNLPMLSNTKIITYFQKLPGISANNAALITALIALAITVAALYWFFGTEKGSALRATGSNELMCRAQGVNTDNTKILGLMLSNALIAFSGAMVGQHQGYSDVNMGIGAIVIGLASLIIGEAFVSAKSSFWLKLLFIAVGSIIYRLIITLIIYADIISASDLKLVTAILVVIALSLPMIKIKINKIPYFKRRAELKAAKTADLAANNGGGDNA